MSELTLKEKIARLPAWARDYVRRLEAQAEPNNSELRRLRQLTEQAETRCKQIRERMEAMTEIFRCAAQGGSEVAKAYVEKMLEEYNIESTVALQSRLREMERKADDLQDKLDSMPVPDARE